MALFRTLVWALNLGVAAILWSAAENEPPSCALQVRLACVAAIMALTLVYVCLLEAWRKHPGLSHVSAEPTASAAKERGP